MALTGTQHSDLAEIADLHIQVPGQSIEQVEDLHLIVAHSLCVALRKRLNEYATASHATYLSEAENREAELVYAEPGEYHPDE